jgi:predicted Zn finger-like uncharacterized protein
MSYTTRCPACGTTFRVVPDQLKVSDGWVRCGFCGDVFDATLDLQEWPADAVAPVAVPPSMSAPTAPVLGAPGDAEEPAVVAVSAAAPEAPVVRVDDDGPGPDALQARADEVHGPDREAPASVDPPAVSGPVVEPSLDADVASIEPPPAWPLAVATAGSAQGPAVVPGFIVQARRRAFWASPGTRAALSVAVILLAGLLVLQWAWYERDELAARWPALRPSLQALCAAARCELAPVRRIDDVVIDDSRLVRRAGTLYVFDLVLRNKAEIPVAMPALELSLTDPDDRVLSRRVVLPQEWPGAPPVVPARGTLNLALNLSISLADASLMAGYRAVLFYP